MRGTKSTKKVSVSPSHTGTKRVNETQEHTRLKAVLKEISISCGLKFDTEVHLNFSGSLDENGKLADERSIDVAIYGSYSGQSFLLIFECKGGDIKDINNRISSWEADCNKMQAGQTKIVASEKGSIKEKDLNNLAYVRICYVFGKSVDRERYRQIASILYGRKFYSWDNDALTYYKKTAATLGRAAKYQLLRELDVNLESSQLYCKEAIRIKQGDLEMFVFGAEPSILIKVGYVYRRASGKPEAYQRIINKDRISKISEFLKSRDALLPNVIIIAFDKDPEIQKEIRFEGGKLYFPRRYCSAWIIDGQHRVFGFLNTRFEELDENGTEEVFELPVVAFKNMDLVHQNRTFVSINYNQKKIDPTLLCDLATALPDLQNELTWPSRLVAELNKVKPLKSMIKISELDEGKPISNSSFARYGLLESLLGYDKKKRTYSGPLFAFSPFKPRGSLASRVNQKSLKQQFNLLRHYFDAVEQNTRMPNTGRDPWSNIERYSLLRTTGINALLLVLSRIMERYPNVEADIHKSLSTYLKPLRRVNFKREFVAKQGGGWKGFRKLTNVILKRINKENNDSLRLFGKKEKK